MLASFYCHLQVFILRRTCTFNDKPFLQIARVFKFTLFKEEISQFFRYLVKEIVAGRSQTGNTRKDFMQLLIQLKEKGRLADEEEEDVTEMPSNNFSVFDFCY
jgi:hypothetical protein